MVMAVKVTALWDMMIGSLSEVYLHFKSLP